MYSQRHTSEIMFAWCSGNTSACHVGIAGSSPAADSMLLWCNGNTGAFQAFVASSSLARGSTGWWRNGSRNGLLNRRPQGRGGSSPSLPAERVVPLNGWRLVLKTRGGRESTGFDSSTILHALVLAVEALV